MMSETKQRFTARIDWRHWAPRGRFENIVVIVDHHTGDTMMIPLDEWLDLKAVQYAVDLAEERAASAPTGPGD